MDGYLTDPTFHTACKNLEDKLSADGDLKIGGILQFFRKHKCNEICKALNIF